MQTNTTIKRKVKLKVHACKLRQVGQNIFSVKYTVMG